MDKDFLLHVLASNKRVFLIIGEVLAALIALESFSLLKRPDAPKWRIFLAKAVITIFVSLLTWPLIVEYFPNHAYLFIGIIGLTCVNILDWFLKKLVPALLNGITDVIVGMAKNWLKSWDKNHVQENNTTEDTTKNSEGKENG